MTNREAQMLLDALILEDKVEGDDAKAVIMAFRAFAKLETIVRCHDCRYWGERRCKHACGLRKTSGECFCNYGKRKEKTDDES